MRGGPLTLLGCSSLSPLFAFSCCQDPPEQGGGHFTLVFSMLARLRGMVDARNPDNTKVQKLGELALLCKFERDTNMRADKKTSARLAAHRRPRCVCL